MTTTDGPTPISGEMRTEPYDFMEWTSPWHLAETDDGSAWWVRSYRAESSCDTAGCCEVEWVKVGPQVTDAGRQESDDAAPT